MLDGIMAQIDWLVGMSGHADLPVGIAAPGIVDPETGRTSPPTFPRPVT
ncbi:hypothetical protein [Palleronia sp. LCG004]|nr:hypothetical protein [Palleronia sp. LCG004]WOI55851.1 hypothetical protein RVY76_12520 [Palleronia sp. LCG004]